MRLAACTEQRGTPSLGKHSARALRHSDAHGLDKRPFQTELRGSSCKAWAMRPNVAATRLWTRRSNKSERRIDGDEAIEAATTCLRADRACLSTELVRTPHLGVQQAGVWTLGVTAS
eukprot:scaffold14599_cov153-Isochrysis_galbana.AAC.1